MRREFLDINNSILICLLSVVSYWGMSQVSMTEFLFLQAFPVVSVSLLGEFPGG
ncbi:hypothetical protein M595_4359 [Lyngbya aestuarii BL J]|uniref:Uncharacterized protein n=1 Tax=Lyngbya aestuarii BL J TaxID=1348334 RepID=U7QEJ9_9CYAN|nr:hypothetical protein M595_4359 [Lyngbya aestuarii BL J]